MSDLTVTAAQMFEKPWVLRRPAQAVRRPPAERYEVRIVINRRGPRPARKAISWHLKKEAAIAKGKKAAEAGHEVQVCWTHPEDQQYGAWLDNADVVWDSREEEP